MSKIAQNLTKKVQQANGQENDGIAIKLYEEVIKEHIADAEDLTDEVIKAKEQSVYKLAGIYKAKGLDEELIQLQKTILPLFVTRGDPLKL